MVKAITIRNRPTTTARASSSYFERSCNSKLFQSWWSWSCQFRRLRCCADLAARGAAPFALMKFNQWRQRLNFTVPSCTCWPSPTSLSSRQPQVLVWPRAFFQRMLFHMAWPGCPRLDDFSLNMSRLQQERRAYRGVGFGGWPWLYSEEFIFGGNGRYIKWLNGQGTCTLPRRSSTELQQENVTFQHPLGPITSQ